MEPVMPTKSLCLLAALTMFALPLAAQHRGGGSRGGGHSSHPRGYSSSPRSHTAPHVQSPRSGQRSARPRGQVTKPRSYSSHPRSTPRSSTGKSTRIHRSQAAKDDFMRQSGHPRGWPGHVVDHIVPLACGGADAPSNMQWQSTEEGKAKDKTERRAAATAPRVTPR